MHVAQHARYAWNLHKDLKQITTALFACDLHPFVSTAITVTTGGHNNNDLLFFLVQTSKLYISLEPSHQFHHPILPPSQQAKPRVHHLTCASPTAEGQVLRRALSTAKGKCPCSSRHATAWMHGQHLHPFTRMVQKPGYKGKRSIACSGISSCNSKH